MSFLSPELTRTLDVQDTWLSGDRSGAVRARVDALLENLQADVRDLILDELIAHPNRARVLLQSVALAGTTGAVADGVYGERFVRLRSPHDFHYGLAALSYDTPEFPNGRPEDVRRLTELLDGTFQGRQYALYLRRPVPEGFDPGPVSRAVHLWLAAIDRGEWKGRHAIYEDESVALELTLIRQHSPHQGGRVMTVGPVTALERLGSVDGAVVDLVQRHARAFEGPLVVALGAQPRWRVPRGYVQQLLYGTAEWTEVSAGEIRSYRAGFSPSGRNLFSDPVCKQVFGLWWLEGDGPDPMAYRAWGHDNPWCDAPDQIPPVDIPRFMVEEGAADEAVLRWTRMQDGRFP